MAVVLLICHYQRGNILVGWATCLFACNHWVTVSGTIGPEKFLILS